MASRDPREIARLRGRPPSSSNLTSSTNKASGQDNTRSQGATKPKIFQYRYPLKRIEEGSDYLSISVLDYEKVGLDLKASLREKSKDNEDSKKKGTSIGDNLEITEGKKEDLYNISSRPAKERFTGKNIKGMIYLPVPQNIQDTTSVTWGEDSLDPLAAFGLAFGADALKDPGGAVRDYLNLSGNKLAELAKDGPTRDALVAAIAGQAFGALGGNVSATGLIARATGQILNPNMELLFQGVNIRSFSFTFNFVARSMREGEEIKKIIRTFKKSMTPSNIANTGASGVFIKSPQIFQLEYKKGNGKHPFLNSFLPMALTNVAVNYTGSNTYTTYYDGTPVHITMQLDFQELNPLYTEDYDSGDGLIGVGY
jgi:hypothetical protein